MPPNYCYKTLFHGHTIFPKICDSSQHSSCRRHDVKDVPYCRSINIRCHRTKFGCLGFDIPAVKCTMLIINVRYRSRFYSMMFQNQPSGLRSDRRYSDFYVFIANQLTVSSSHYIDSVCSI